MTDEQKIAKEAYRKRWYARNREKMLAYGERWRALNSEKMRGYSKKWGALNRELKNKQDRERRLKDPEAHRNWKHGYRARNRERLQAQDRALRAGNPEVIRAKDRARRKKQYDTDPAYRIFCALRARVWHALKRGQKTAETAALLGAEIGVAMSHLEAQFLPGMTWDNHSPKGWHIDHKRPCASFDLTQPEQQRQCFHYTNLQPLWARDNLSKGDNW